VRGEKYELKVLYGNLLLACSLRTVDKNLFII